MTPLMYAAQRGLSKLVKLFCEKGAAVDMQDSRGMTVSLILLTPKIFLHIKTIKYFPFNFIIYDLNKYINESNFLHTQISSVLSISSIKDQVIFQTNILYLIMQLLLLLINL